MTTAPRIVSHARQSITTRYHGPTNTRGARVSATAEAGRVYVSWDYSLSRDGNHDAAALALILRFGWQDAGGVWQSGGCERGNTYVWTPAEVA